MLWIHPRSSCQPVSITKGNTLKRPDTGFSVTLRYRRSQSSHLDRQRVNTLSFFSLSVYINVDIYHDYYVHIPIQSAAIHHIIYTQVPTMWPNSTFSLGAIMKPKHSFFGKEKKWQVSKHMDNDNSESAALSQLQNQRLRPPRSLKTCEHIASVTHVLARLRLKTRIVNPSSWKCISNTSCTSALWNHTQGMYASEVIVKDKRRVTKVT